MVAEGISKVTDEIYRGPRLDDFRPLLEIGVKAILNLEDDSAHESMYKEKVFASSKDIKVHYVPMSEIWRPKKWQLIRAIDYMRPPSIYPIYVHCKHGQDRTGYAIAAYRMLVQGWTFKMAYGEAKDMGHHWWFAPYLLLWPKSLKELVK